MGEHSCAIAPCVKDGDDELNGPARPLHHRRSLELGCSQLSLEVEERPLHFNGNHSSSAIHHHVNCPPIGRRPHGNLQPNPPGCRCGRSDRLGDPQLPGVAKADAIGRIQADDQVMASGSREAMHDVEARHRSTTLSLADQRLSDAGSLRHLRLRQT